MFIPSSSDCCSTMDKYNLPSHSGFRRKEFRLNQCPCPGFESSTPLGVAPNRLSVNQCSFRFRINASCVLRRVLVCQASATTGRETYWGWLVYALISSLRQLTSLLTLAPNRLPISHRREVFRGCTYERPQTSRAFCITCNEKKPREGHVSLTNHSRLHDTYPYHPYSYYFPLDDRR